MIDQDDCESRPEVGSSRKLFIDISEIPCEQGEGAYSNKDGFAASSTPIVRSLRCSIFRPGILAQSRTGQLKGACLTFTGGSDNSFCELLHAKHSDDLFHIGVFLLL